MRVLITGITGMAGSHLADYILNHHPDVEIHGLCRWRSPLDNIRHRLGQITLHHGDLTDLPSLYRILNQVAPNRIFHLAAQSFVTDSFSQPTATLNTNIIGTANLLEAIRIGFWSVDNILVVSSSEVYGQPLESETPIKETNPLRPTSPYAVSKVGEDLLSQQYHWSYKLPIVRVRPFTYTGPRRGSVFAESAFAKQIAEIESGKKTDSVKVGNLDSVRTWCDVRDTVRAIWMALEKCPAGEVYNIGGQTTCRVRDVLTNLSNMAERYVSDGYDDRNEEYGHIEKMAVPYEVDPNLLRPSDVTLQIPDCSKFTYATGWKPEIPLEQTLQDLLNWYREKLRS